MANRWGNNGNSERLILGGSIVTADGDCSHEIKRCLILGRKVIANLDSILKSRDITWSTKVHLVKAMVFPVVMYGCESWTIEKAECRGTDLLNCGVGEDSWEFLGQQGDLTSQSQRKSWKFIRRTDAEAESLIIHWPLDAKKWLFREDPDAGKDWRHEEKGTTEDEMVGGHHQLDGHESEQAPEAGDGEGSLVCCSPWDPKV